MAVLYIGYPICGTASPTSRPPQRGGVSENRRFSVGRPGGRPLRGWSNMVRIRRRMVVVDGASRGTARWPFSTLGIPFVGDGVPDVPPAPAGRGFRKSEIFGGPSRRPAPTGLVGHGADSPKDGRCRWCIPRNGTMAVPYVLYPKYAKESPVSGETGDLFVFSTKNVRPYTPSGNRQVSTMSDHTCLTRLSTSTMLDSLAPGTAGRPVGRFYSTAVK